MITARQEAIQIARQKLALAPVYLDTETTGIERNSEIIEICIIDDQENVLFQSLVKPQSPIPPDVIRIHGITQAAVENAPIWPAVWPEVERCLSGRSLGIYNADFDLRLMQQTHARYRLPWSYRPDFSPFCIMKLYAQYYGEWNRKRGTYRWFSLEDAGHHCRIPLPNSHRAHDDTLLARAVLHHMASDARLSR